MTDLTAGQELPLVAENGQPLSTLRVAVGWDKERTAGYIGTGAREIDLDATAVQFAGGELFDIAFYNNLKTRDGSVEHLGDNQSGRGEGDDEVIALDLARVYSKVDTIVFLVSSYSGQTLEWIGNAYFRLLDDRDTELARFTLTLATSETGMVMAKLARAGDSWTLRAIGEGVAVTVPTKSIDALKPYV